jgi:hypothetical protein
MRYSRLVFLTQIRPLWVGDLGTGKKNEISQIGVLFLRFSLRNLIKKAYDQHALNNQNNFKLAKKKIVSCLRDLY